MSPGRGPTRRTLLLGLAPGALIALAGRRARARTMIARRFLYLQPLGDELPDEDVTLVKTALESLIGLSVKVLPRADMPANAWYPPRRRHRADKLLDFLDGRLPADGDAHPGPDRDRHLDDEGQGASTGACSGWGGSTARPASSPASAAR